MVALLFLKEDGPPTPLVGDESTAGYMMRALRMPARAFEAHDRAVRRANSQLGGHGRRPAWSRQS